MPASGSRREIAKPGVPARNKLYAMHSCTCGFPVGGRPTEVVSFRLLFLPFPGSCMSLELRSVILRARRPTVSKCCRLNSRGKIDLMILNPVDERFLGGIGPSLRNGLARLWDLLYSTHGAVSFLLIYLPLLPPFFVFPFDPVFFHYYYYYYPGL